MSSAMPARLTRPQRIAISLIVRSPLASLCVTASRSASVEHDRTARDALQLPLKPVGGHAAIITEGGERGEGDGARPLVLVQASDNIAKAERLGRLARAGSERARPAQLGETPQQGTDRHGLKRQEEDHDGKAHP